MVDEGYDFEETYNVAIPLVYYTFNPANSALYDTDEARFHNSDKDFEIEVRHRMTVEDFITNYLETEDEDAISLDNRRVLSEFKARIKGGSSLASNPSGLYDPNKVAFIFYLDQDPADFIRYMSVKAENCDYLYVVEVRHMMTVEEFTEKYASGLGLNFLPREHMQSGMYKQKKAA